MTTSRWINLAIVVAFLICPLAWYVAATSGSRPPSESRNTRQVDPREVEAMLATRYSIQPFVRNPPPLWLAITNPEKYRDWRFWWLVSRGKW
ncbi:MAG: hypothetical protein IH991_22155 [Planctomycetes bacterium]|nr:hypothetical protein [Planctomycetota bacterium]